MATSAATLLGELGLDEALLRRLDRLALRVRQPAAGGAEGVRRSRRTGNSVEFADYRTYVPGDDVRRIDWNAFARSDRLTLRLTTAEEDGTVSLLLDCSRSMAFGTPRTKAAAARALAAALVWVALRADDRATVVAVAGSAVTRSPVVRGRRGAERLWTMLGSLSSDATGFEPEVVARLAQRLRPGVCVVLSDFMTEAPWEPALAALRGARQEVVLVQLLCAGERAPELSGDLRLRDVESGAAVEVTVTPALLDSYSAALVAHTEGLRAAAVAHAATFVRVMAETPTSEAMLSGLRRAGVLR